MQCCFHDWYCRQFFLGDFASLNKTFLLSSKNRLILARLARNACDKNANLRKHDLTFQFPIPIGLLANWTIRIQPSKCPKQISLNSDFLPSRKAVMIAMEAMEAMTRRTDSPLLLLRIFPILRLLLTTEMKSTTEMKRPIADESESQPHLIQTALQFDGECESFALLFPTHRRIFGLLLCFVDAFLIRCLHFLPLAMRRLLCSNTARFPQKRRPANHPMKPPPTTFQYSMHHPTWLLLWIRENLSICP